MKRTCSDRYADEQKRRQHKAEAPERKAKTEKSVAMLLDVRRQIQRVTSRVLGGPGSGSYPSAGGTGRGTAGDLHKALDDAEKENALLHRKDPLYQWAKQNNVAIPSKEWIRSLHPSTPQHEIKAQLPPMATDGQERYGPKL